MLWNQALVRRGRWREPLCLPWRMLHPGRALCSDQYRHLKVIKMDIHGSCGCAASPIAATLPFVKLVMGSRTLSVHHTGPPKSLNTSVIEHNGCLQTKHTVQVSSKSHSCPPVKYTSSAIDASASHLQFDPSSGSMYGCMKIPWSLSSVSGTTSINYAGSFV